jgi:hypothetical protein
MNQVSWMVTGPRSGLTFITAPTSTLAQSVAALDRLDIATAAETNPPKPGWYRVISKMGYAWYLVIAVVVFLISFAVGATVTSSLLYGVLGAAVLGPITGGLLTSFARKQATTDGAAEQARAAAAAEHAVVRIPQVGVVEAVRAVLGADPSQEDRVRELAWRISATDDLSSDPGADAAATELFALHDQLNPEAG